MNKKFKAKKVAKIVDGCHHCPFISEHGISGSEFSNVRCDVLNKALPKYGNIRVDCPLPNYKGKIPILTEEQQDDLDICSCTHLSY